MARNGHVLRLREFQSVRIGSEWNAAERTVPSRVVAELERLQAELRTDFFEISRRRIEKPKFRRCDRRRRPRD